MRDLTKRIEALEGPKGRFAGITRWHAIFGGRGESLDDARGRYQRDVEPIGETEGVIFFRPATTPNHPVSA